MKIDLFRMERTQCLYENEVTYNLSESGVLPLRIGDLVGGGELPSLDDLRLKYPPSNGSPLLRERIASFYGGGATRDNVLVTTGGSEANFTTLWGLLEKTDRVAVMIPNYMQSWGLARAFGRQADPYRLVVRSAGRDGARWALDVESLHRAVTKKTRVVFVTNPNNPTGAVLTGEEMDEIVRAARRAGAWIVSDEVYRGAEVQRGAEMQRDAEARRGADARRGAEAAAGASPTFWGRYERVVVTAGLSKAFGLPGLRLGWIVGPERLVRKLWSYQDYTTLTPTLVSDRLAAAAMEPGKRDWILARTRAIIAANLPRLEEWIRRHDSILSYVPPVAGAIALVRYDLPIGSEALFDRLRRERSVLVTPGSHFGIGRYLRIGYGYDAGAMLAGLAQVDPTLAELSDVRARRRVGSRQPTARAGA